MADIDSADQAWCDECRDLVGLPTREVPSTQAARLQALRALVKPKLTERLAAKTGRYGALVALTKAVRAAQSAGDEAAEITLWTQIRDELERPIDDVRPADGRAYQAAKQEFQGLVAQSRELIRRLSINAADDAFDEATETRSVDYSVGLARDIDKSAAPDTEKAEKLTRRIKGLKSVLLNLENQLQAARSAFDERMTKESEERQAQILESGKAAELIARIQSALEVMLELRDVPGAQTQVAQIRFCINEANKARSQEKWSRGLAQLRDVSKLANQARQNHARVLEQARERFADVFTRMDELQRSIDAANHNATVQQLEVALKVATRPLLDPGANEARAATAREMLTKIEASITTCNRQAIAGRETADARISECRQAAAAGSDFPIEIRAPFARRLEAATAMREQALYVEAISQGDQWLEEWRAVLADRTAQLAEWNDSGKKRIQACIRRCDEFAGHELAQAQTPTPTALNDRLRALLAVKVGETVATDDAFQQLRAIEGDADRIAAIFAAHPGLVASIRAKKAEFAGVKAELETALADGAPRRSQLEGWEQLADTRLDPVGDMSAEGTRLQAALDALASSTRSIADFEPKADALIAELQALATTASATRGDDWNGLAMESWRKAAMESMLQRVPPIERELEALRAFGVPQYDTLKARIRAFRGDVRNEREARRIEAMAEDLTAIQTHIAAELRAATTELAAAKARCTKLVESCRTEATRLRDMLERYDSSWLTKDEPNLQYSKLLLSEVDGIDTLVAENDLEVLDLAEQQLLDLRGTLRSAAEPMRTGEGPPQGAAIMSNVDKQIAACKKLLNDRDLKKFAANTHAEITAAVESLEEQKRVTPIENSLRSLSQLKTHAMSAQRAAAATKAKYEEFQELVKAARTDITGHTALADLKEYRTELLAKVARCEADGANEGRLAGAKQDLREIVRGLKLAAAKPELLAIEAQAVAAAKKLRADAIAEVEEHFRGLVKRTWLPEAKSAIQAAKGDMAPYDDLKEFCDSAHSAFKKSNDYEVARSQLKIIERRVLWLKANPGGAALHARQNLDVVEKRWVDGVRQLRSDMQTIVQEVTSGDTSAGPTVASVAGEIQDLFLETAFGPVVKQMMDATADASTLRSSRERGLAIVRRYRASIQADKRLLQLSRNPFLKPFAALTKMNQALFAMERNLLVSAS